VDTLAPNWLESVAIKAPKAYAAGNVSGSGPFGLLSCEDETGVRKIVCYWTTHARQRTMEKWDRKGCGQLGCSADHIFLEFGVSK